MKRREFVTGMGLLMGASMLSRGVFASDIEPGLTVGELRSGASGTTSSSALAGHFDVHQQVIPAAYAAALQARGIDHFAGRTLAVDSAGQALSALGAEGSGCALLSLPAPGVWLGDGKGAAQLARDCNDQLAAFAAQQPQQLGWLAALPLPDVDQAVAEAARALDQLGADGVALVASVDGRFLGDSEFDPLLAELNRREARVLVLPNLHPTSAELQLDVPGFAVEQACDLTRAAVNLVLSGSMERYPAIRWILAEGGGFLPYAAWRVSLANAMPGFSELAPQGVMTYLRRFYFATSSLALPALAVLGELVELSRALYARADQAAPPLAQAQQLGVWTAAELAGIRRGHALSLFPRFAQPGEVVVPAPVFTSETSLQRLKRAAAQPLAALMQRMKD